MTNLGHTAAAYLISRIKVTKDQPPLKKSEIIFILVCGNILDIDYFLLPIIGVPGWLHHYSPSHTPFFGIIFWFLFYILFRHKLSKQTFILGVLAIFSHLILDDVSYWLSFIRLTTDTHPQIFWLFPFDSRFIPEMKLAFEQLYSRAWSFGIIVEYYFVHTPFVVLIELIIICIAVFKSYRDRTYNSVINLVKRYLLTRDSFREKLNKR